MPSLAYGRFLESMVITYDMWHDGDGYDLDALRSFDAEESLAIEALLVDHLKHSPDWRDVESLYVLGSPPAMEAVKHALLHPNPEVRAAAIRLLQDDSKAPDPPSEQSLAEGIQKAHSLEELSRFLDLAPSLPTLAVKRALLDCARLGQPDMRVNAAAMVMFLCGQASEPFDWAQRPFFLLFLTEDTSELRACWGELRKRTGI